MKIVLPVWRLVTTRIGALGKLYANTPRQQHLINRTLATWVRSAIRNWIVISFSTFWYFCLLLTQTSSLLSPVLDKSQWQTLIRVMHESFIQLNRPKTFYDETIVQQCVICSHKSYPNNNQYVSFYLVTNGLSHVPFKLTSTRNSFIIRVWMTSPPILIIRDTTFSN